MSTEGLGISDSMPHAGTPWGLPGRRGVFSWHCKWTSGLGEPRLSSHYSTVFCLALSSNWLSRSLICTKLVIGMGNEKWEIGSTQIHIFTWWVFVSWLVGEFSEMGTRIPCKHTTGILVGSTVHREGLSHFSICNISIEIIVTGINM